MKITRFISVISVVLFCLVNSAAIYAGEIKPAALKPQVLIKNVNVWDGNPLEDLEILKKEKQLKLVIKDGKIYKNTLD